MNPNDSNRGPLAPIEDIAVDPETAITYFVAVSHYGETFGQTLSLDEFTYEQNVSLTAAALLDGLHRNQLLEGQQSSSDFLTDVIEETKIRNKNKVSSNQADNSGNSE